MNQSFWDGFEKRAETQLYKEAFLQNFGKGLGYVVGSTGRAAAATARGIGQGVGAIGRGISRGVSGLGESIRAGYYQGRGTLPPAKRATVIGKDAVRSVDVPPPTENLNPNKYLVREPKIRANKQRGEVRNPEAARATTNQGIEAIEQKANSSAAQPTQQPRQVVTKETAANTGASEAPEKGTFVRNATAVMKRHPYMTAGGGLAAGVIGTNILNDRRY